MYFTEIESGGVQRYVPRSTQIDLEAGVCNRVRQTLEYLSFFSVDQCSRSLSFAAVQLVVFFAQIHMSPVILEQGTIGQKDVRDYSKYVYV